MGLRIVFFGTPEFAVPTLRHLNGSSHRLVGVVTQPDRPRGRGQKLQASPVKALASTYGIPVLQPERLKAPEFIHAFGELSADLGVVAAYGKILPSSLINTPRLGMINVHASLLPRWRGAAPIHRAVVAGDMDTGVTIMRVVQALDAGPMLATVTIPIGENETSAALEPRLAEAGAALVVDTIDRLAVAPVEEIPQDDASVTYAHRLERSESDVDWNRPAAAIHNQIRGLQPWPLAAARLGARRLLFRRSEVGPTERHTALPGTIISIETDALVVATNPGTVRITELQPEGRPSMPVREFLNGHRVAVGDVFQSVSAARPQE